MSTTSYHGGDLCSLPVQLLDPLDLLADGVVLGDHQVNQGLHLLHRELILGDHGLLALPVHLVQLPEGLPHHTLLPLLRVGVQPYVIQC